MLRSWWMCLSMLIITLVMSVTWPVPLIGSNEASYAYSNLWSPPPSHEAAHLHPSPTQELDQTLPVLLPDRDVLNNPPESQMQVTWFGHSTVLVQMDGVNLLTDPVFSQRASPLAFLGCKRYRQVPCTIHDLPPIHAVLISHTHYAHLDLRSVQTLNARFGAELRWFVPQGLAPWMADVGCENIMELGWWDENCIPENPDIRFVFTPAQHWTARHPFNKNKVGFVDTGMHKYLEGFAECWIRNISGEKNISNSEIHLYMVTTRTGMILFRF